VAEAFARLQAAIRPGVMLAELDRLAADHLARRGAQPLYKGYRGNPPSHPPFPGVICASLNHEICHGLPDDRALQEGDLVGIDIGLKYHGWCGDACVTFPVGKVSVQAQRLLEAAEESRQRGIAAAQPGAHLSDIGAAIREYAEGQGFSVVREWGGHGIGRSLHEAPSVPHWSSAGEGPKLRPGMVFTVEPMINAGRPEWRLLSDGWTVVTADGSLSAQFEHTIAVTKDGPVVLSEL
jgi:methionyl aminopeptidase